MSNTSRRKFLGAVGATIGTIALGDGVLRALEKEQPVEAPPPEFLLNPPGGASAINFRYAPPFWQSTFCFPDDPSKSLVGKSGELLYGYISASDDLGAFAERVVMGLRDTPEGQYAGQSLETPKVPIITTKLEFPSVDMKLVVFATNEQEEGRVDNLMVEITPKENFAGECFPVIRVLTERKFKTDDDDAFGLALFDDDKGGLFLAVDSPIRMEVKDKEAVFSLKPGTPGPDRPLKFFLRFPQEAQEFKKIRDLMKEPAKLLGAARTFWQSWKTTEGKVSWQGGGVKDDFLSASARNILESREIKNGKKMFQVGPTIYRGTWFIDGTFLLEAARYLGYDKDAQDGLLAMWDLQNADGSFFAGAGNSHWKDTAAAVWALMRQAELTQNWDTFNELYPDAHKAMMYLRGLRTKAANDGTANGKYGLLPRGFGDSGIGGVRSELTNSLWTLMTIRVFSKLADRFFLPKRTELREFGMEMRLAFTAAQRAEMRQDPGGFSYLPMLMAEDARWSDPDERKRPRPQAAQIYLSQAIYPGMLFAKEDAVVKSHLQLMNSILKEDVPAETGWLGEGSVWPYNAPVAAQAALWAGMPELARTMFDGFLNHASPLFAWREEQSLKGMTPYRIIGDMPHNWASAEYIRYLRHMMILEEEERLVLLGGIMEEDLVPAKPMSVIYSPTRWGRVSLSMEPLDDRTWHAKFTREDFDEKRMVPLTRIILPRQLPGGFQFDKAPGVQFYKTGNEVLLPPEALNFEATWKIFRKTK